MSRENILLKAESFSTVKESQVSEETKQKSNTENGVYVKGMALPFGKTSRNGVQYTKDSVEAAHEDLQGRTMLFNHKQDWVTGHILNTEITDKGMYFEGDINPNAEMPNGVPVANAIERGDINSVSIQAFIEQLGEPADEDAVIGDMETEKVAVKDFLEISAVSIPGFPQAEALPEHLQQQGVKPVTEALGTNNINSRKLNKESLENPEYEIGDFVEWEFGGGSSQGEVTDRKTEVGDSMSAGNNRFTIEEEDGPLYKIKEWDETQGDNGEFTNQVVKFEDSLKSADRPAAAKESINREQYEFAPIPSHVLYDKQEDAKQRAENLGLDAIHEHEMSGQIYYMAGETHQEWLEAIDRENPLDRESTRSEPFAGYDDFEACVADNQDKDDPEAYCGEIKDKTEEVNSKYNEATFDDYPEAAQENARMALEAKEDTGDPNDCGTQVGWERANQLDNGESLSEDTIGRMAAFRRHEDNKNQGEEGRADCGWMMWNAWGGDEGINWAENKIDKINEENLSSETKQLLEEADIMSNNEDNNEEESAQSEQVNQDAFIEFVAQHMEGLEADDIASAVGDSNFTGLDQGAVAELLAMEFELDEDVVMDAIGQLEDMENPEEEYDKDKDDDDMEEDVEDIDRKELEEKFKGQEEKINSLEERLETILDNDEGSSNQESPSAKDGDSVIERRPSFRGLTD